MPIEILMPALSPTMTEGNLAKWLKKEGDEVHSGDVLAEIETDKATMEVEAVDEGTIGKILVPEGAQGIKVNAPIALLLGEGEEASALSNVAAPVREPPPAAAPQQEQDSPPRPDGSSELALPPAPTPRGRQADGRIFASPLARRMAQHAGLDLAAIRGSGPQGRIVKADIDKALAGPARPAVATPGATPGTAPGVAAVPRGLPVFAKEQVLALAGNPPYTEKPHSGMRRVIARRLSESKQTIPHYYM